MTIRATANLATSDSQGSQITPRTIRFGVFPFLSKPERDERPARLRARTRTLPTRKGERAKPAGNQNTTSIPNKSQRRTRRERPFEKNRPSPSPDDGQKETVTTVDEAEVRRNARGRGDRVSSLLHVAVRSDASLDESERIPI